MPESALLTVEQKLSKEFAVKAFQGQAAIKDVDTVGRTVTGFYNTFNFYDSDGDVLLSGSAKRSIKLRGPESNETGKIKHALHHDLTQIPGKIVRLEESTVDGLSGIYFETKMADTTLGNDTLKNYIEGVWDNHSIGFQYMQIELIEKDAKQWQKYLDLLINPEEATKNGYMFVVKEINLFEGSTVAFGANRLTPYLGVKSGNKESMRLALYNKILAIEKTLHTGTQSDDMMHLLDMQMLQLKQMITELTESLPAPKPDPQGTGGEPQSKPEGTGLKFINF